MNDDNTNRSVGVPLATPSDKQGKQRGQDARTPFVSSASPFFDPFEDIERHRHHLPHWQQGEVWQFVTWRLADSVPQSKLGQWTAEREAWLKFHPPPWDAATEKQYHEQFSGRVDEWLDAGHGSCVLRDARCAQIMARALCHFAGARYELGVFVVMPNHVHVLFRPRTGHALETILHSWKSFTAKEINKALGRSGTLWQEDYWDRMVRGATHLAACVRYIEQNPIKARLRAGEFVLERNAGILPAME